MALLVPIFRDLFWTRFEAMSGFTDRIAEGHRYKCERADQMWPEEPADTDLPDTRLVQVGFDPNLWGGTGTGARAGRPIGLFEWHIRLADMDQDQADVFWQLMMNLFAGIEGGPRFGSGATNPLQVVPGAGTQAINDTTQRFILSLPIEVQFLNISRRAETALS